MRCESKREPPRDPRYRSARSFPPEISKIDRSIREISKTPRPNKKQRGNLSNPRAALNPSAVPQPREGYWIPGAFTHWRVPRYLELRLFRYLPGDRSGESIYRCLVASAFFYQRRMYMSARRLSRSRCFSAGEADSYPRITTESRSINRGLTRKDFLPVFESLFTYLHALIGSTRTLTRSSSCRSSHRNDGWVTEIGILLQFYTDKNMCVTFG